METEPRTCNGSVVLVVDDDRAMTRLVRQNLEATGTRVVEALTGFDGIKAIRDVKVDLILLDLGLPDFDGLGILGLVKFTRSLQDIPVIVVSVDQPDASLARCLGLEGYIRKPFHIAELLTKVRTVMDENSQAMAGRTKNRIIGCSLAQYQAM